MSNLRALLCGSRRRGFDVIDKPIWPHDRFLRIPKGTTHADNSAIWTCDRSSTSEHRIRGAELHAVGCLIRGTHSTYIGRYDLQVVNFHLRSPSFPA